MADPSTLDLGPVLQKFGGHNAADLANDQIKGLSSAKAAELLAQYGPNELAKEEGKSLMALILEQFDDMLVKILLAAAAVSFGLAMLEEQKNDEISPYVEPAVILIILILNAIVGVWQESNAESALEALKSLQPSEARCKRDGVWSTMNATGLVPGDIIEVVTGKKIPADARLVALDTTTMKVDQSALTGESVAASKDEDAISGAQGGGSGKIVIQDKKNMLFSSTNVVNGKGYAVVTTTGMSTEVGLIQQSITEAAAEEEPTPLAKKIDDFGELLAKVILYICIAVWAINWNHFAEKGTDPETGEVSWVKGCIYYFKIAVALAVAAIPEGLPAVITTCLALGTRKMAKKNAIVRKLPSVETLGCTTVICSDKTGTLTTNQMTVERVVTLSGADANIAHVTGHSFNVAGEVDGCTIGGANEAAASVAQVCALCNGATIEWDAEENAYICVGEPTEGALKVLAEKMGHPAGAAEPAANSDARASFCSDAWLGMGWTKVETLEFSRDRKSMSVLCAAPGNGGGGGGGPATPGKRTTRSAARAASPAGGSSAGNTLFVKGASEMVLERCTSALDASGKVVKLTPALKKAIEAEINACARSALRTLCLATKSEFSGKHASLKTYTKGDKSSDAYKLLSNNDDFAAIESDLTFVGLVAMRDPPRAEVADSIAKCVLAGIRIIVITGDNKLTAESICRDIGVFGEEDDLAGRSFTGSDFFDLSEAQQTKTLMEPVGGLRGSRVFSRAEPAHKKRIVQILKAEGQICAMTGDGVNDAPALKMADIGIAMGIAGTEVAKEASDMVLADDNFATIVSAVEEGRAIYNNMQAFIRYLISSNIGEVAAIFLTATLGFPEGLIPVQLLWVNLVTDGPPATALGFNPADADIMEKPPRKTTDDLITPWVFFRYMVVGLYVGWACVASFGHWYVYDGPAVYGGGLEPTYVSGVMMNGGGRTSWTDLMGHGSCNTTDPGNAHFHLKAWADEQTDHVALQAYFGPKFDAKALLDLQAKPCMYYDFPSKTKASTISLSVLVTIEMLNALNALSEDGSLLQTPPWANWYLILAMAMSFAMHFVILEIDGMDAMFSVCHLTAHEWWVVVAYSMPVIFIDEILKAVGRSMQATLLAQRRKEMKMD